MRMFGFNTEVRKKLVLLGEKKIAVALGNCEIRKARGGEELELFVAKGTEVSESKKVFDIPEGAGKRIGREITLNQLNSVPLFHRVTLVAKAIHVEEVVEVSGGKKKQDILIGDSTGTARFTIWEGEIGNVEEGGSYRLGGVMVREFRARKFLSTAKDNSHIEPIADIGEVIQQSSEKSNSSDVDVTGPS